MKFWCNFKKVGVFKSCFKRTHRNNGYLPVVMDLGLQAWKTALHSSEQLVRLSK